jgi:HNH endonuclease
VTVDPEAGLGDRLEGACSILASVVAELDPGCLTGRDAVSLYGSIAGFERLALAGKALLGPRIETSGVWREDGHRNAASLLATLEGISAGQAKVTLDLGKQLEELPGTEEAMRKGLLSRAKATELADAGILDPDREADLLSGAEDEPLAQVKERCQRSRATSAGADPLATIKRIRAERFFSSWTDADGAFCFKGRDTADRGAKVLTRMNQVTTALRKARRSGDQPPEPEAALRADAFFALVTQRRPVTRKRPGSDEQPGSGQPGSDRQARSGSGSGSGSRAAPGSGSGPAPPHPPSGGHPEPTDHHPGRFDPEPDPDPTLALDLDPDLYPAVDPDRDPDLGPGLSDQAEAGGGEPGPSADSLAIIDRPPACSAVVRVDLAALLRGSVEPGEQCEIDGQGPIPVSMARSLTNDCYLRLVFHRAGDIKAISHQGRTINAPLRTALVCRDRTCVVPGCNVPYGLEIDHILPMAEGGPTELDNLALLCHHHHFLKTFEGWTLTKTGTNDEGSPTWSFDPEPPFGQEPDLGIDTPEGRERWRQRDG